MKQNLPTEEMLAAGLQQLQGSTHADEGVVLDVWNAMRNASPASLSGGAEEVERGFKAGLAFALSEGWLGAPQSLVNEAIAALHPSPEAPANRQEAGEVEREPTWRIVGQDSHFGPFVTIDGVPHDQVVLCFWRNQIQPIHLRLPGQAYVADLLRLMDEHGCNEVAIIPVRHKERVSLTRAALTSPKDVKGKDA